MIKQHGKRLSAGVVVVREDEHKGTSFLILRAFDHWDFPKGLVEEGEQPLDAAIREVAEETTVSDLDFAWGKSFMETGPYSRGKTARYYLARTLQEHVELPVNPELGRPEHNEYCWTDYRTVLKLTSPRVRPVVHWAANLLNID